MAIDSFGQIFNQERNARKIDKVAWMHILYLKFVSIFFNMLTLCSEHKK